MKIRSTSKSPTQLFGELSNGSKVYSHEISNSNGMTLKVMDYGATVIALKKSLKNGKVVDVVLGFDALSDYVDSYSLPSAPYFGATVGRYAGRINNSTFSLNGKSIDLNNNNNGHSLHGGNIGFSQKIWQIKNVCEGENPSITLSYLSPDGEENYPGDLSIDLTYTLSEENELIIEYVATTSEDTVINLTHHSYFNLDGHNSTILEQELLVHSNKILETNEHNIPTGQFLNLEKPSYTISARYWKDGYDALVKYNEKEIRRLTITELKRIQSFPDDYIIIGSKKDIIMQIGNAVPCRFAYHLGKYMINTLQ